MPPYELNGKQIALVDQSGQPVVTANYCLVGGLCG
jgi:hypothetical protein